MNGSFLKSHSAAGFEKLQQKKNDQEFILIKFERTEIDQIRQISESGHFPIVKTTKKELMIFSGVPLS
jgi:hypothetical protein